MAFGLPSCRRRHSTSRGVAPEVSAQRGTSGAVNGGGGRSAPDPAHVMKLEPAHLMDLDPAHLMDLDPAHVMNIDPALVMNIDPALLGR
jgi:hypothetical protein